MESLLKNIIKGKDYKVNEFKSIEIYMSAFKELIINEY